MVTLQGTLVGAQKEMDGKVANMENNKFLGIWDVTTSML